MRLILMTILLMSTLFGTKLDFTNDYDAALELAKKENKDVYMLITSEDCRWCRKFENTTLSDDSFVTSLEKEYVILHVSRDTDKIPSRFFAKRVPKHYFLTNDGEEIYSFLGYWNIEDFSSFLSDVEKRK